ncbi:MAG: queuosine precursor transporter [bacterium]
MDEKRQRILIILVSIFAASLAIASVLASKILMIAGLVFPAGVLAYSITFPITDVISEVWGKKRANQVVISGFFALLVVLILARVSILLPAAGFWQKGEAFNSIIASTTRIIIASFVAYLISQFHDVWAFHFWKKVTKGKHLWLRNNASTLVSQLIDTVVFITIAFYGTMPLMGLIKGQYLVKAAIAIIDTPLVYLIVRNIPKSLPIGDTAKND